ncbi:hypothetical protein XpiCFBP4643_00145 [Xanthomonas pisi]|uniref:Uncharacterized protein n=1 Tax=Xanthomonas pisi TaxID=56457 RepID=A0A2S7D8G5_9XANT|nr:hypothetical protein XpiCFBP4643_00145 [Xanthomonas pisi]
MQPMSSSRPSGTAERVRSAAWPVEGAVPSPLAGHAINPSLGTVWRHPCRHTVPQAARTAQQRVARSLVKSRQSHGCLDCRGGLQLYESWRASNTSHSACTLNTDHPTDPCPPTVAGPYAAWLPRKRVQGRTCSVSCVVGGR